MYIQTDTYYSHVIFWRLRLIYIQYKPYYPIYCFFYGQFDHSAYDFISWLKIYSCECSYVVDKTNTLLMNVYGLYLSFMHLCLSSSMVFHDSVLVLVWWLITFLWLKPLNQKITKTNSIFLFVLILY